MNMDIVEGSVPGEQYTYYMRNKTLIDFTYIPDDIKTAIINAYDTPKKFMRMKLFNYLVENKLNALLSVIEDF
jgi:hypothetical protein